MCSSSGNGVLLLMGRGLTVFLVGFNMGTIGWVEISDTMKRVGTGWVDDTVSHILSSVVTLGWGGLRHWADGVGRGGW